MNDMTPKERAQWGSHLSRIASTAPPTDALASGNAVVPAGNYGTVASGGVAFGGALFQSPGVPRVCCLTVSPLQGLTGVYDTNQPAENASSGAGIRVRVQYGVGAAQNSADMDLRSGTYQLPACQFVRVWLQAFGIVGDTNVQLAIAEGSSVNVDVPLYTSRALTGAVPNQARAVELPTPGKLVIGTSEEIENDWTVVPAVQYPMYSPVRIDVRSPGGYVFTPAAAFVGTSVVRWLLSL